MSRRFLTWTLFMTVVLLPLAVYAMAVWYNKKHTPLPFAAPKNHQLTVYHLLDQHGRPASLTDWNNKIVIANVFFTHCPVICPKMTKNLSKVQQVFHGRNVLLSSFSIDPERDSISQLKNYAQKMQVTGNWQLLTGDKKVIYTFARKSLLVPAAEGDGGADDFIHSERLVLMDRNKKIRGFYKGTDELETVRLINDIKKLLNE